MATWYSLPAEVRLMIYRHAFEEITVAESTHGSIFADPVNPCPDISDIFLDDQVPEQYQRWVLGPDNDGYEEHCRRAAGREYWNNEVENEYKHEKYLRTWKSVGGNGLLGVNRLTYQEALPIAYAKTTFKFEWHDDMMKFVQCVRSHNNAGLVKHIHLRLQNLNLDVRLHEFILCLKHDGLKRAFENLETIAIEFDNFSFKQGVTRWTFYADQDAREGGWGRERVENCVRDLMQTSQGFKDLKIFVCGLKSREFAKYLSETATADVCPKDEPGMDPEDFDQWYKEFGRSLRA